MGKIYGDIINLDYVSGNFIRKYKQDNKIIIPYNSDLLVLDIGCSTTVEFVRIQDTNIIEHDITEWVLYYTVLSYSDSKYALHLLELLSELYGDKVIHDNVDYFITPTIDKLITITEQELFFIADKNLLEDLLYNIEVLYTYRSFFSMYLGKRTSKYFVKFKGLTKYSLDMLRLFCLGDLTVFPIDTEIKRLLFKLYSINVTDTDKIIDAVDFNRGSKSRGIFFCELLSNRFILGGD